MKKIMITGSCGQIGTDLIKRLRKDYGVDNVIATDIRELKDHPNVTGGKFEVLDVMDRGKMMAIAMRHNVDTLIHLASLLSATAEKNPQFGWNLNMGGLVNALEVARELNLKFFTPSSIAAFGPSSPPDNTPQDTILRPTTMYGVTKVAGELLCDYYYTKYKVDTRGVRFPGLISYEAEAGGGTTDYAVEIYYEALKNKKYTSYIGKGSYMDMMYMPDAIDSIINLLNADPAKLEHRNAFNITAMSFEPEMIAASIKKYIPEFKMDYNVDPVRQGIANSWPNSLDASAAKKEWGFAPKFDLDKMTLEMLTNLSKKLGIAFEPKK